MPPTQQVVGCLLLKHVQETLKHHFQPEDGTELLQEAVNIFENGDTLGPPKELFRFCGW